jgi:hypothetical protein
MIEYLKPTSLHRFGVVVLYLNKEIYGLGHCLDLSGDSHEDESYTIWIGFCLKLKIFYCYYFKFVLAY